jgi:hypothetical protein
MSDQTQRAAADFVPMEGAVRNVSAGGERIQIPAAWRGKWMWFFNASDANVFLNCGDGTVVVDPTTVSGLTAEVLTLSGDEPKGPMASNTGISFRLRTSWTHFAHRGAGSGTLHFGLGQGPGIGNGED